jgi:hypothetical protein
VRQFYREGGEVSDDQPEDDLEDPSAVQFGIRMSRALRAAIEAAAVQDDRRASAWARLVIEREIERLNATSRKGGASK